MQLIHKFLRYNVHEMINYSELGSAQKYLPPEQKPWKEEVLLAMPGYYPVSQVYNWEMWWKMEGGLRRRAGWNAFTN